MKKNFFIGALIGVLGTMAYDKYLSPYVSPKFAKLKTKAKEKISEIKEKLDKKVEELKAEAEKEAAATEQPA